MILKKPTRKIRCYMGVFPGITAVLCKALPVFLHASSILHNVLSELLMVNCLRKHLTSDIIAATIANEHIRAKMKKLVTYTNEVQVHKRLRGTL